MKRLIREISAFIESVTKLWKIRETRIFILIKILESLAVGWFFSTYVLFLREKGLNLFQTNLLNVGFMTISFLFDPYTGRLADKVGQKRVFLWGQVVHSMGMFVYFLGHVFGIFLLAEIIGAIGKALISEALESWIRNVTDENISHEVTSVSGSIGHLATIPSAVIGGILGASFGLQWPWFLSSVTCLLVAVLSSFWLRKLPEKKKNSPNLEIPKVFEVIKFTWRNTSLRFYSIIALVVSAAVSPLNMFWAPVLKDLSSSSWWLGSIWIFMASAIAIGSFLAKNKFRISTVVASIGIPMLLPVSVLFISFVIKVISGYGVQMPELSRILLPCAIFTIVFHEFGRGAIRPLLLTYCNKHIDDHFRSTANSVRSAAGTLGMAIGLLVSGVLTLIISPLYVWGISGAVLVFLAIYSRRKE